MSGALGRMEDCAVVSPTHTEIRRERAADLLLSEVEFWCGQPSRLHDRFKYTRDKAEEGGEWKIERLAP